MSHYRLTGLPDNPDVHARADASREWHTGMVEACATCGNHWPLSMLKMHDGELVCPDDVPAWERV